MIDEGTTVTIDERTYRKQCGCEGTSSGPRTQFETHCIGGHTVFLTIYRQMVCDVCQKPWREQYNFWPAVRMEDGTMRKGPIE